MTKSKSEVPPAPQTFTFADNDSLMVIAILLKRMGGHAMITETEIEELSMTTKISTQDNHLRGGLDLWVK